MSAPPLPPGVTREQLLSCIDRELRYREVVFPRRVEAGKMGHLEARRELERELELVRAVRAVVDALPPTQATLFDARARAAGEREP